MKIPLVRRFAALLAKSLLYVLVILPVDLIFIFVWKGSLIPSVFTLVLFLEGGLGLLAGVGIALSATPSISRVGEQFFGTSLWSNDAQKHAEIISLTWITVSTMLVLAGFLTSTL